MPDGATFPAGAGVPVAQGIRTPQTTPGVIDISESGAAAPAPPVVPIGAAAGAGTQAPQGTAPAGDTLARMGVALLPPGQTPPLPTGAPGAAPDHPNPTMAAMGVALLPSAGAPPAAPRAPNDAGMPANVAAAAGRAIAGFAGMPVDAVHWLATHDPIDALAQAFGASPEGVFGYSPEMRAAQQQAPVGGSRSIGAAIGTLAGVDPYAVTPQTPGEKWASVLTEGAIGALMPWGAARAVPAAAGGAIGAIRDTFGAGSALGNAASGAAASGTSQAVADNMPGWVPDWMRPVVATAAGMLGGAAPVVAGHAGGVLADGTGAATAKLTTPLGLGKSADIANPETGEPFTDQVTGAPFQATAAQATAIGNRIARAAGTTPGELASQLEQKANESAGLPGAQPSMGQMTGNLGLLGRERELQTLNRAPFTAAQAAHKVAQSVALRGLAGPDAQASATSDFVASVHTRLREAHDAALRADGSADAMLGTAGTQQPSETGAAIAAAVSTNVAPTFAAADAALRQAQHKLHAAMKVLRRAGTDPLERQHAGERVQSALAALDLARKDFVSQLYAAVDPTGTKMLPSAELRDAARAIVRDMSPMDTPMSAAEAHLFQIASGLPDAVPFKDLQVLRSVVGEMRRQMRRGSPNAPSGERAMARVTALANAIDRTTVDAVEAAVQADPQAAQAVGEQVGEAAKAQAAEAEAQAKETQNSVGTPGHEDLIGQRLAEEAANFAAARRAESKAARAGGGPGAGDNGARAAGPETGISGSPGAEGQAGKRSRGAARDQSLPREAQPTVEAPNWTPEDAAAFRLANAEHRERVQDFRGQGGNLHAVGSVLQRGADRDTFRLTASEVGPRLFNSGKRQGEDTQAFLRAIGGKTDAEAETAFRRRAVNADGTFNAARFGQLMQARRAALDGLTDYLLGDFRAYAERNGQIDPARAATWLADRRAALSAFPDVAQRLGSVAKLAAAAKALQGARADLDKLHPLAGVGETGKLPGRYWASGAAGADRIAQYRQHTGGSPDAMALLQDHALSTLRADAWKDGKWSNAGFAAWENKYAPALAALPALAAKVRTVADAQRAILDAAAQRAAAVKAFETSAARFWIGTDPGKAVTKLLASANPVSDAQQIMRLTRSDPAAQAGVRKAFAEWLINRVAETSEAGTTGVKGPGKATFQRLFEANPTAAGAFRTVLGDAAMETVRRISADMDAQARSWNATKIHGSPGSAADTEAIRKEARLPFIAQMFGAEFIGKLAEELSGATGAMGIVVGGAAGAMGLVVNQMRSLGMKNMRDLEIAALLDPNGLGKLLLERAAAPQTRERLAQKVARRLAQVAAQQAPQTEKPDER